MYTKEGERKSERSNAEQTVTQLLPVSDSPGQCDEQHSQQTRHLLLCIDISLLLHTGMIKLFFKHYSVHKNEQLSLCSLNAQLTIQAGWWNGEIRRSLFNILKG